jgi:hypothetical protein
MRLSRGTLDSERVEGRVYVLLEDDVSTHRSGESSALISEMRDQIEFLRRELERRDQLLAAALSRIPEIEAPSDERGSPVTAASPGPRKSPLPTRRGHRRPQSRGPGGAGCSADEFPRSPISGTSSYRISAKFVLRVVTEVRCSPHRSRCPLLTSSNTGFG